MKNWTSIVDEGSIVILYDIPESLILKEKRQEGIDYKLIERNPNEDELKAEKNRLMARIKEIDTILEAS